MTAHPAAEVALSDDELLLGLVAPPEAPRLYPDYDWNDDRSDEAATKREVDYLTAYRTEMRARLRTYARVEASGGTLSPAELADRAYATGELTKARGELTAIAPAAARHRITIKPEPPDDPTSPEEA